MASPGSGASAVQATHLCSVNCTAVKARLYVLAQPKVSERAMHAELAPGIHRERIRERERERERELTSATSLLRMTSPGRAEDSARAICWMGGLRPCSSGPMQCGRSPMNSSHRGTCSQIAQRFQCVCQDLSTKIRAAVQLLQEGRQSPALLMMPSHGTAAAGLLHRVCHGSVLCTEFVHGPGLDDQGIPSKAAG